MNLRKVLPFLALPLITSVASSCSLAIYAIGTVTISYTGESSYKIGSGQSSIIVENLKVHWYSGPITISYDDVEVITFREEGLREINKKVMMRYKEAKRTLTIQPASNGRHDSDEIAKMLTIKIPYELQLKALLLDTVISDAEIAVMAEKTSIKTVNGNVHVVNEDLGTLDFNSVSGGIEMESKTFESLKVNVVNSHTRISLSEVDNVDIKMTTVLGKKYLEGIEESPEGKHIDFNSVNGNLYINKI